MQAVLLFLSLAELNGLYFSVISPLRHKLTVCNRDLDLGKLNSALWFNLGFKPILANDPATLKMLLTSKVIQK